MKMTPFLGDGMNYGFAACDTVLKVGTAFLRLLPPEFAHETGMFLLRVPFWKKLLEREIGTFNFDLSVTVPGLGFIKHPLGLAAGFDKNCDVYAGILSLGVAFWEIGTVTPKPQPGNPTPRIFRKKDTLELINRMGFNNIGVQEIKEKLIKIPQNRERPLGINLGKNKNTPMEDALNDYLFSLHLLENFADFFVINISSPNTPNLRDLATPEFVGKLAAEIKNALRSKTWLKLDPDLDKPALQKIVNAVAMHGFAGLVLTNTHKVTIPFSGGQSGHPLAIAATKRLEWAYEVHQGQLPMLGSGGVLSGRDVFEKIIRGASAVELYTALVYRGPFAVVNILAELIEELKLSGFKSVTEAIGSLYK